MKAVGLLFVVLGLGVGGLWLAQGMKMATESQAKVEKKTTDEFGDEVVTIEWQDLAPLERKIGLDLAAPAGGGLVGLGGLLLFLSRRKKR